jgi:hypothetical protein
MTKLTSFQAEIRPLSAERDIEGMKKGLNLASYDEVLSRRGRMRRELPLVCVANGGSERNQ